MRGNNALWIGLGSVGVLLLLGSRRSAFAAVVLGSPIEGRGTPRVTPHGHFGARRDGPPAHSHQGVDLVAEPGSHVLAVGDGEIVATSPGLGKTVRKLKLASSGNWGIGRRRVDAIVYADLGKPLVSPGDRVRRGDAIALVDKSGFVHFAVKQNEVFVDPREAGFAYDSGLEVG